MFCVGGDFNLDSDEIANTDLLQLMGARVVRTDDELGGPHFEGDIEDDPLRSEPVHPDLHVQLVVEIIGKKAMILVDVLYDL